MNRALVLGLLLWGAAASAQQPVLLEVKGPKRTVAPVAAALTSALKDHERAPVRVRMPAAPRPAQVRSAFKKADATAWVRATVQKRAVVIEVLDAEGDRQARVVWRLPRGAPRTLPEDVREALIAALPAASPPNYLATLSRERAPAPAPTPEAELAPEPPAPLPEPEPVTDVASVPAPAPEPAPLALATAPTVLELMVGGSVFSRQLSYVDDVFEALASYNLPVGPAWAVEGNLFPGAWSGVLPEWGLVGEVKRSAMVFSREGGGTAFPTEHVSLQLGALYRRELGPFELRGLLSLINDRFELRAALDGTPAPRIPAVNYLGPRAAAEARVRFSALTAGVLVGYRHPFAVGELGAPDYFPRLTGGGFEGAATLHWAFTPLLGLQASFQYRRYFWAMNSRPGDPLVAGGALDQYLQGSLGLSVWLR